jgi:hypothetical protein
MTGIGFVLITLGAFTFISGNPNGMGTGGISHIGSSQLGSQYANYQNYEITRI